MGIQDVRIQVEFAGPRDRSGLGRDEGLFKEPVFEPSGENPLPGERGEIHFADSAIRKPQPHSVAIEHANFNWAWTNHDEF